MSRMGGAIPLLPVYAFMVQTGTTLPLAMHDNNRSNHQNNSVLYSSACPVLKVMGLFEQSECLK